MPSLGDATLSDGTLHVLAVLLIASVPVVLVFNMWVLGMFKPHREDPE